MAHKTSLIIPVFNRNQQLRKSLLRMLLLTPPDELVIVDDGSSDGVIETAREIKAKKPDLSIVYLYHNNPTWDSCSIPKNIGLRAASSELLIYSEPEVLFISDVIGQMKAHFEQDQTRVVTAGQMYFSKRHLPPFPNEALDKPISHLESTGITEWIPGTYDLHGGDPTYTFARNLDAFWIVGVLKDHLLEINGWDEDMSLSRGGGGWGYDDIDCATRLRIRGYGQYKHPDMAALHQWHERPPQWIMDSWKPNEDLMKAKGFDGKESPEHPKLKANQGREWGVLNGLRQDL